MKTIQVYNMNLELTQERTRRIEEAIKETQHQIDREMKYSPDLRKNENIDRWQKHIEKLNSWLS